MKNDYLTNTQNVVDSAAKAADGLLGTASNALHRTEVIAQDALDSAKEGVADLRKRGEDAAGAIGARAGEMAEKGLKTAHNLADKATKRYNSMYETACCYVEEKPVQAVLISAAVGAVVAAYCMSGRKAR